MPPFLDKHPIAFAEGEHLVLHRRKSLTGHPKGMRFSGFDAIGEPLHQAVYYSIGGGFVLDEDAVGKDRLREDDPALPYAFAAGETLLHLAQDHGLSIISLMLANERIWRGEAENRSKTLMIWQVMKDYIARVCVQEGLLPGGLKIKRRAPLHYRKLKASKAGDDPFEILDWVNLYALALSEENVPGGAL